MGNDCSSLAQTLCEPNLDDTNPQDDIFTPVVSALKVPDVIPQFPNHPVNPKGVLDDPKWPIQTNKFYSNWLHGSQTSSVWTHPYSLSVEQGWRPGMNWGIGVTHVEAWQVEYPEGEVPISYYVNPLVTSLLISAKELRDHTRLSTDSLSAFFVNVYLIPDAISPPIIRFPCYQGMGFVTAVYFAATPNIQGKKLFKKIEAPAAVGAGSIVKYRITLEDDSRWLMYVVPTGGYNAWNFKLEDTGNFTGPSGFNGTIQVAKNPSGVAGEAVYDKAAGSCAKAVTISAFTSPDARSAKYTLSYTKEASSTNPLLLFALPHHISSLDPKTAATKTNLRLRTTTKGMATGLLTDTLSMIEPRLPHDMGFGPWCPGRGEVTHVSDTVWPILKFALQRELPMVPTGKRESLCLNGKGLAKYASIVWVAHFVVKDSDLAGQALDHLKSAILTFVKNWQTNSLVYDTKWKGVVGSLGYHQTGSDFGNTKYSDHHVHWAYYIYAAAVIGACDGKWVKEKGNFEWVQMLVRDFAEGEQRRDGEYPFSRSFDWWHGHSWANGLYECPDGKELGSTTEDGFASYALKLWGRVIGDRNMEARASLMLAIQSRAFNTYFYLTTTNPHHPPPFLPNKVLGLLSDNKVSHTTTFGHSPVYTCAYHMLPTFPHLSLLRHPSFVRQEWSTFFSNTRANVGGGWRGVLYANLALIDAKTAWDFFKEGVNGKWDGEYLDDYQSMTWCLMWSAALGGEEESVWRYVERRAWERFREGRIERERERRRRRFQRRESWVVWRGE